MPYIEFTGPPGCGKTTAARGMLRDDPAIAAGRRSLSGTGGRGRVRGFGLPPEGAAMWLNLAARLPRDVALALRFWRDTWSLGSARKLLLLLVKSRALAASRRRWVVDQGLQQHILDALARGRMSAATARRWRSLCRQAPWGPEQLVELTADRQQLLRRVRASEKHLHQCRMRTPEDYVGSYLRCASLLRE